MRDVNSENDGGDNAAAAVDNGVGIGDGDDVIDALAANEDDEDNDAQILLRPDDVLLLRVAVAAAAALPATIHSVMRLSSAEAEMVGGVSRVFLCIFSPLMHSKKQCILS